MPFVLYVLAVAVFAQATSEFMLSGLLPGIAADLDVSLSAAGLLTSAFAVGMVIGAPLMAAGAARLPRRSTLFGFLVVFLVAHVVGAVTTSYSLLLATRVISALACAGFLAIALTTAAQLVGPDRVGRAAAVLLAGTTLATVVGVPGGAVLGQMWGWRSAFWAVALLCLPALLAVLLALPRQERTELDVSAPVRREWAVLRDGAVRRLLLLGALVNAGTFAGLTYLAPVITEVAGLAEVWVPVTLALFGLGAFAGVTVAGRVADRRPRPVLVGGGAGLMIGWAGYALLADVAAVAVAGPVLLGGLSFAVGSTLIARSLRAASVMAPRLSGGFATASFNVGAVLGPWTAGTALAAAGSASAPLWVAAALVAAALLMGAVGTVGRRAAHLTGHRAD